MFTIAREGQFAAATAYLLIHLILGLGSVWFGFYMSKLL